MIKHGFDSMDLALRDTDLNLDTFQKHRCSNDQIRRLR